MDYKQLNNGMKLPQLGFGVYQIPLEETEQAVYQAIKTGYRLIDTAIAYSNEVQTGQGIKRAIDEGLVTRADLFITTKLFIQDVGEEKSQAAIEESLKRLGVDYIDLYLIHQPYGDIYGSWRALVSAQKEQKIKAIGVSNFDSAKLIEFIQMNGGTKPQVNQIEVNPWNQRNEDFLYHQKYDVQIEAWAPFAEGRHGLFENPTLLEIATTYHKTVGQIVLRWAIQRGAIVLAKTIRPERMAENLAVFDFELSLEDMAKIAQLDKQESAFFNHHDPLIVEQFMERLSSEN